MPFIAISTVYTGTDDIVAHNNGLVRTKNILVNVVSDLRNTWQLLQQRMLVNFCKKLLLGLQRLFFGLIRKRWNRDFDSLWLAFTSFGLSATALCIVLSSEPHIEVLAHFSYDQLTTLHTTYFVERFYSISPRSPRKKKEPHQYQIGKQSLRLVASGWLVPQKVHTPQLPTGRVLVPNMTARSTSASKIKLNQTGSRRST